MTNNSAGFVLVNGRIYTSNPAQPWADALRVNDGLITVVGTAEAATAAAGLPVHDLGGRLVLPGLIDAHTHPTMVTQSAWHIPLPQTDDLQEILDFVRRYGEEHPKDEAPHLYFEYYPSTLFATGSAPTRQLLDTAISDRPVLLQDHSDHASWVNSRMIELLGVTRETPDPIPGLEMFVRDEHGDPTGHILEMAHMHFADEFYDRLGWRPPQEITAETVAPFFEFLTRHGVTGLFEALVHDESILEAITQLVSEGRFPLYYDGAPRFRTMADLPEVIEQAHSYQARFGSDRVRVSTLKLFLDGTNESGNSAVIEPMVTDPSGADRGEIQMETAELADCFELINRAGLDIHIHMVGDRAFRVACDAAEIARQRAGEDWRCQITFAHCELVDPSDMGRPAELGIIVNWTNHWSGGYFGEEARTHLGDERWNRMYEFTQIADSGATLTFASDVVSQYELHRADPFFGMQTAMTRVDPEFPLDVERYPGSVRPSAASQLTLERLIAGHTVDAARQLRIDDRAGSLEVGKQANLVVLSDDLFALPPAEVGTVKPVAVIFQGAVVSGAL
ncbi:MAG: amidohydrolase [Rhodoglobus sp.]